MVGSNPQAVDHLVGRAAELHRIRACLLAGRNVLLEGPVGVGKTRLALEVTRQLKREVFRIDGDSRYNEQKLAGWFDPPLALQKGFNEESFLAGPLVQAMKKGGVLFINELNRLPEGVQNILLPAIDERLIHIPRLGEVRAAPGFLVIATQNPKEFVATSHLSEAILDRFELVRMDYQSETEESEIVRNQLREGLSPHDKDRLVSAAVALCRLTRVHSGIRRGASIRAAISIVEISAILLSEGSPFETAFLEAAQVALPTRIEWEQDGEVETLIRELVDSVLKKKPS